ncbi:MAG: hypothetical protein SGARI_005147 [Bacillariaceae sp.]
MKAAELSEDTEWMDVVADLQETLVEDYKKKNPTQRITVTELRVAARRHPDICFWVKHNRARKGTLKIHDKAPNPVMRLAKDCSRVRLLSKVNQGHKRQHQQHQHPHAKTMASSEETRQKAPHVTFKMIYIAEAHAFDEWKVSSGRFLPRNGSCKTTSKHIQDGVVAVEKQPTTAEERCALARDFCDLYGLPYNSDDDDDDAPVEVLVDDPSTNDQFEKEYAPWPLRLYLIDNASQKVEWIAQPNDCSYDLAVQELMGQILGLI